MAIGPGLIAGGAALLWALSKGKSTTPKAPICPQGLLLDTTTQRCVPVNVAPTAPNTKSDDVKTVTSLISTGVGFVGSLIPLFTGGGTTTAVATGGGSTAATAVATSATSGFYSGAGAGGIAIAAIVLIAIVATLVTQGISANINTKHYWEQMIVGGPILTDFAKSLFANFMSKSVKWYYGPGRPVPADIAAGLNDDNAKTYGAIKVVDFTPVQLRDIGLACLYLASQLVQAKNDALVAYYSYMRWTPQQMATAPDFRATPGINYAASVTQADLRAVLAPLQMMFSAVRPPTMSGNPVWDQVTAPFTTAEMTAAATRVFGADLPRVLGGLRFMGTVKMLFLASVEGYGGQGGSWQTFVETIGSFVGWSAWQGAAFVTNTASPYGLDTWWLIDPVTGNRFAPLETHSDNILRLSIKGTPIPSLGPQAFAGYGRRRFGDAANAPGFNHECQDPQTGNIVYCAQQPGVVGSLLPNTRPLIMNATPEFMAQVAAKNAPKSSGMLPLALIGGAVLLLKSGALGGAFGGLRRRRFKR